jgi:hypothetical protein
VTTEAKVEAVAVIYPDTGLRNDAAAMALWRNHGYDTGGEPLYPQSALDALRGEVAAAYAAVESKAGWEWKRKAEEAERRVAELEALLRAWHAEESRYGVRSQAPGHLHQVPGIWDSDNGPLAGTPCAKCALWEQIREIARSESP